MLLRTFILREEVNANALWSFLKANWRDTARAGKPLAVTVQEYKAKRSGDQNRYYWQRLNEIAEQAWIGGRQFSADAWHEHFKRQFVGSEDLPHGGTAGISTTSLSVAEFAEYVGKVEAYAASELGIELS
jgi:hypothetical protein